MYKRQQYARDREVPGPYRLGRAGGTDLVYALRLGDVDLVGGKAVSYTHLGATSHAQLPTEMAKHAQGYLSASGQQSRVLVSDGAASDSLASEIGRAHV